ncbi:MAG: SDR family NAD(P)-dependent oxidoreductase [Bacteroidales bacterium]|nr:SDR family NAD(P)-dependent oxidoreductase [Bacteroidales bacterium]
MAKIALITGATSGIGRACAEKLAANGYDVIITGRRADRLASLKEEIEKSCSAHVLALQYDVSLKTEAMNAICSLPAAWKEIDLLINNAGLALDLKPIHEGNPDDWDTMVDTNIKGLLYTTRLVSEIMAGRQKGHIINIGSIAGKEVYPNGNVYSATKHAVDGLTRAMRIDLMKFGIKVSQIAPGAVETEFSEVRFKGNRERAKKVYEGYQPLKAEDVAEAVFFVANLPPHVNINDLVIMPTAQAGSYFFNRK